jgi:PAS domain S-box-containing protein
LVEEGIMRKLRLTTFGGLAFRDNRRCAVGFPTRKAAAMAAYLAMHPGKNIRRELLANMFWGDKTERQARHSLSQALSDLRRILGDDTILADGQFIHMNIEAIESDAFEMARLVDERRLESLALAEQLYQGDFLAGMELEQEAFDAWMLAERERLRQLAERALGTLLMLHADDADGERTLRIGRSLLAIDPYDDKAHCGILRAYAKLGQPRLALAHFRKYCEDLRRDLGEGPSDEILSAYDAIFPKKPAFQRSLLKIEDYAFVIEQLPQPALVTDLRNRVVGWNGLAEELLGFTKAEMQGRSPGVVFAPRGDATLSDGILSKAVHSGRWTGTAIVRTKDGRLVRQRRVVAPLYATDGELIGAFGYGLQPGDGSRPRG